MPLPNPGSQLRELRRSDSGQGNTEYALLIVVVLLIFGVILALSQTNAPQFFTAIWDRLKDAVAG